MTDDEKYFFDLNGYLVLRDVVDPDTIRRCNEAIDHYDDRSKSTSAASKASLKPWPATSGNAGAMRWSLGTTYCEPFRH